MSPTRKKKAPKRAARKKKNEPDAAVAVAEGPERLYDFADQVAAEDAADGEEAVQAAELVPWVTFTLAGEHYALPASAIQEILRVETITRVPHAPYTVRGIINMRGRAVPVIDCRTRLGVEESPIGPPSRILVTRTRGRLLGLLVDSAEQVAGLDPDAVEPPPADVMTGQSEYIVGVYRQAEWLLILLDVEKVLLIPDSLEAVNAGR